MKPILPAVLALALLLLVPPPTAEAQEDRNYTIQGTVMADAAAQRPLAGAQVSIQGTTFGTLSDQDGRFQLRADLPPGDYDLQVSFIGRRAASIPLTLGTQTTITLDPIVLEESAVQLEEIVVSGTGVESERRALGNTIATVSGEQVNEAPGATSIDRALQGKVAGALISQNNGQPGGGVSIRLRGTSSILGGAEPLIVIDGVILENNSGALVGLGANASYSGAAMGNRLADIPPSDIERIEVLKGAAAAALYGSRANNGVIQIFTKRGVQGEPTITVRSENSWSQITDRYDLLDHPLAGPGDVTFGPASEVGEEIERFLYQDELFQTGFGTTNQLAISGGSDVTGYYLSGNWTENEGAIRGTDFGRIGARARLTQTVTDWLDLGAGANYLQTESNFVPEGEQVQGVLTTLIFTPSSFDPYFDPNTGQYPYSPIIGTNPFDVIDNWAAVSDVNRFVGNLEANIRPTQNLRFTYLFGIDDSREEFTYLQPPLSTPGFAGSIQNPIRSIRRYNSDFTANHTADLTASLGLTSTAGARYTFDRTNTVRAAASGLNPGQTTIGGGGATPSASQGITEISTLGGFIQERLSFADRLFLTGGLNVEGSSAFGEDERWQLFPRVSGSYVLSQEPAFQASAVGDFISSARLRLAYGETGGQPPGAYFRFQNYFNTAHAGRPGFVPSTLAGNPNLKPERQQEWEGGFELGVLADRLAVEFTYYDQTTNDLVLSVPISYSSGFTSQFQNIGEVSNKGVEITLNTVNFDRSGFGWNSRVLYASNRNRVEDLGAAADSVNHAYLNYVIEGEPIGVFAGAYYPRDASGDIILSEAGIPRRARGCPPEGCTVPGDSIVLRKILGDPNPDFTLSLANDFRFGENVELSLLLDGRFGNDVANFSRRIMDYFGASSSTEEEITGEVPVGFYFLNLERHLLYEEFVEDGSFVKLREVALRVGLPNTWASFVGARGGAITLSGRNLYTWTDYTGLDPEINLFSANTVARGVDFSTSPIPRTFALGFNFTF